MPVVPARQEAQIRGIAVQDCLGITARHKSKHTYSKSGGVAQVAKHLASKLKILSLNSSTTKKK
jgi:hypothetical protein